MNWLWGVLAGVVLVELANWTIRFWRRSEDTRRQQEADAMLATRGLSSHFYLASMGTEDPELREALDRASVGGRIVIDRDGGVVGKLLPKVAKGPGPHLRLVVDNTKSSDETDR